MVVAVPSPDLPPASRRADDWRPWPAALSEKCPQLSHSRLPFPPGLSIPSLVHGGGVGIKAQLLSPTQDSAEGLSEAQSSSWSQLRPLPWLPRFSLCPILSSLPPQLIFQQHSLINFLYTGVCLRVRFPEKLACKRAQGGPINSICFPCMGSEHTPEHGKRIKEMGNQGTTGYYWQS